MIETPETPPVRGPRYHVVLVEPQFPGNIGHVARSMMNFGLTSLHLVNPCPITEQARDRAVHAQTVIDHARHWGSFKACADAFDHLVAFSGKISQSDRTHRRTAVALAEHADVLRTMDGDVALVFGREDDGLNNEQLGICDAVVWIPTSPDYESMNLSHAVTVALYELTRERMPEVTHVPASHLEKEVLFHHFDHLLSALRTPDHRRVNTARMFRRLVGRAGLSRWEFHRLMGVVSDSLKGVGAWPPPTPDGVVDGDGREGAKPERDDGRE